MLQLRRGGLTLCDAEMLITPALDEVIQRHVPLAALQTKERRDGSGNHHITIAFHKEWRQVLQSSAKTTEEMLRDVARSDMANISRLRIKGLGTATDGSNRCYL